MPATECDCGEPLDASGECKPCKAIESTTRKGSRSPAAQRRAEERRSAQLAERVSTADRQRTAQAAAAFDTDFARRRKRGQRIASARHR